MNRCDEVEVTERQMRVLRAVAAGIAKMGYAPSVRELTEELEGKSTNGMIKTLISLDKAGLIRRDVATARGIVLTELGVRMVYSSRVGR
jgi:SOS-response transcriptional repressor LexA